MSKHKNPQKIPSGWICNACAKELGGNLPNNHRGTAALKTCSHCNGKKQGEETFIFPACDYIWTGHPRSSWD